MVGLMLQDTLWRDNMIEELKQTLETMTKILTRTRIDITEYQKDMCILSYVVGKMQGKIDILERQEENKKAEG